MKKLSHIVSACLVFLFSCSSPFDASVQTQQNSSSSNSSGGAARLASSDCGLCMGPSAEISGVSNGANCSKVISFRVWNPSPVNILVEKWNGSGSFYPFKFIGASTYSIGEFGYTDFSVTDLNPFVPAPSSGDIYYRIKLLTTPSPTYSSIVVREITGTCTGLSSNILLSTPSPGGLVIITYAPTILFDYNSADNDMIGPVSEYQIEYYGSLGGVSIPLTYTTVPGSSSTEKWLPISSGPYTGNGYLTCKIRAVFVSGYISDYNTVTRNLVNGVWSGYGAPGGL